MKSFAVQVLCLCALVLTATSSAAQISGWPEQEPPNRAHSPRGEEELNSDPVWLATGEFHLEEEDLRIPGPGFDFVWKRIYRARGETGGPMGHRWSHSYDAWVEYTTVGSSDGLILHDGTGRRIWYPSGSAPDVFTSPGRYNVFEYDEQQAFGGPVEPELTWPDMTVWTFFEPGSGPYSGRLKTVVDRNGNTTTLTYSGTSGQLTTITDTRDKVISLNYDSNGRIDYIEDDTTGRRVRYAYYGSSDPDGSLGDLKSVTSPYVTGTPNNNDFTSGKTRTYVYNSGETNDDLNHYITEVINAAGETTIENTYEFVSPGGSEPDYYRVIKQEHGDGFFNYTYEEVAACQAENGETRLGLLPES